MTNAKRPSMTQRNLIWLVLIAAASLVVGATVSVVAGVVAGVCVLVVSEIVERAARRRRKAASGA